MTRVEASSSELLYRSPVLERYSPYLFLIGIVGLSFIVADFLHVTGDASPLMDSYGDPHSDSYDPEHIAKRRELSSLLRPPVFILSAVLLALSALSRGAGGGKSTPHA